MGAIVNPVSKAEIVLNARLQAAMMSNSDTAVKAANALIERYLRGQKTSGPIYHMLPLQADTALYQFFSAGLPSPLQDIGSNMTKNVLDNGNMLIFDRIQLAIVTYTAGAGITSVKPIYANGADGLDCGLTAGSISMQVNNGEVIPKNPIRNLLPFLNGGALSAGAVIAQSANNAAGTAINYGVQQTGHSFLQLPVPLVLDEQTTFGVAVSFNPAKYNVVANTYLYCGLDGLRVVPNPNLI